MNAAVERPALASRAATTSGVLPGLLVLAVATAFWLWFGVGAGEIALFLAYEAAFVVVPGWALYRLLRPRPAPALEQLAFGWALGYVLELSAFTVASAIGARSLFVLYLPAVLLFALLRFRATLPTALRRDEPRAGDAAVGWSVAALCALALGYFAVALFAQTPLPWDVPAVLYSFDLTFHLGVAAEALHHWPVQNPFVAGVDFPYHIWNHLHLAAISDVTGLELSLLLLRLSVVPLVILFVIQVVVAGRLITGQRWIGPLAALLLVAGELDLEPGYGFPFLGIFHLDLWISPTFLHGLVFFVPAVLVLAERLGARAGIGAGWREWILFALFFLGCASTKAAIIPVVLGGLVVYAAWALLTRRRIEAPALVGLAIGAAISLATYLAFYRNAAAELEFNTPDAVRALPPVIWLDQRLGESPVATLAVFVVGLVAPLGAYAASLVGLPWLLKELRGRLGEARRFLLSLAITGLAAALFLNHPGNSHLFLSHYALVPAALLSAEGLFLLAKRAGIRSRRLAGLVAFLAAWILALLLIDVIAPVSFDALTGAAAYAVAGGVVAALLALVLTVRLDGRARELRSGAVAVAALAILFVALWRAGIASPIEAAYGFAVVGTAALALAALRAGRDRRPQSLLLLALAVLAVGFLDLPLDHAPAAIRRPLAAPGVPSWQSDQGLTAEIYRGLRWLRAETPDDAVIAVNNYDIRGETTRIPAFFDYSAFAERRAFLGGWLYPARADVSFEDVLAGRAMPFPERLRLNEAVFRRADRAALRVLVRDYGVRYLLVDRAHGSASPLLRRLGTPVFANPSVVIYAVGDR